MSRVLQPSERVLLAQAAAAMLRLVDKGMEETEGDEAGSGESSE